MQYVRIDDKGYVFDVLNTSIDISDPAYTAFPEWPKYEALRQKPDQKFNYETLTWEDLQGNEEISFLTVPILQQRKQLLYGSDWTQIPNNPLNSEKQAQWATYRQELRDIPSQSGYPFNVIWPTPPQG